MKITTNYQLNFNPANNCKNNGMQKSNPQFKARFTAEQLKEMTKSVSRTGIAVDMKEYTPRLYTLLQYLAEIHPGSLAKLGIEDNFNPDKSEIYARAEKLGFVIDKMNNYKPKSYYGGFSSTTNDYGNTRLLQAFMIGDEQEFDRLLNDPLTDINEKDWSGRTILQELYQELNSKEMNSLYYTEKVLQHPDVDTSSYFDFVKRSSFNTNHKDFAKLDSMVRSYKRGVDTRKGDRLMEYIKVDGKNIYYSDYDRAQSPVDMLERALLGNGASSWYGKSVLEGKDYMYMQKTMYEQKCFENLNKTADDIINDFAYENLKS